MRTTIEDNKKNFQQELWTSQQSLTKTNSESIILLNAKKETKKVEFVDHQQSTLDQEKRQLDSADSIGKEMTHFKPIRLMPLSAIYIKFKPEALLKSRRSAFCLVAEDTNSKQNQKQKTNKSQDSADAGQQNVFGRRNGEKSKEKIICNIMLNKTNCKKLIQEKGDFELAKMLQEYESNGRTTENGNGCANHPLAKDQEPSARTRRYYLRTRSKHMPDDGKDETVPAKRVKMESVAKKCGSNKVVVNGRNTRSSATLNGDYKVGRLTRGRRKK